MARARNIIGMDVTELAPVSSNKAPDFLAAKLVYKCLSYIFQKEIGSTPRQQPEVK
jgi:agmatinase